MGDTEEEDDYVPAQQLPVRMPGTAHARYTSIIAEAASEPTLREQQDAFGGTVGHSPFRPGELC